MAKKLKFTRTDFHKDPSWTDGPYKPISAVNEYAYTDAFSAVMNAIDTWYNQEYSIAVSDTKLEIVLEIFEEE